MGRERDCSLCFRAHSPLCSPCRGFTGTGGNTHGLSSPACPCFTSAVSCDVKPRLCKVWARFFVKAVTAEAQRGYELARVTCGRAAFAPGRPGPEPCPCLSHAECVLGSPPVAPAPAGQPPCRGGRAQRRYVQTGGKFTQARPPRKTLAARAGCLVGAGRVWRGDERLVLDLMVLVGEGLGPLSVPVWTGSVICGRVRPEGEGGVRLLCLIHCL